MGGSVGERVCECERERMQLDASYQGKGYMQAASAECSMPQVCSSAEALVKHS